MAKHRAERPKIQAQFADLKRGLTAVTDAEWEGIPEVGNLTRKKRKTEGRTYVVPDSILVGDRERGGIGNVVQDGQENPCECWYSDELCGNWPGKRQNIIAKAGSGLFFFFSTQEWDSCFSYRYPVLLLLLVPLERPLPSTLKATSPLSTAYN